MTLTERHIECAHLCARLEVAGQEDTKVMAQNGVLILGSSSPGSEGSGPQGELFKA